MQVVSDVSSVGSEEINICI